MSFLSSKNCGGRGGSSAIRNNGMNSSSNGSSTNSSRNNNYNNYSVDQHTPHPIMSFKERQKQNSQQSHEEDLLQHSQKVKRRHKTSSYLDNNKNQRNDYEPADDDYFDDDNQDEDDEIESRRGNGGRKTRKLSIDTTPSELSNVSSKLLQELTLRITKLESQMSDLNRKLSSKDVASLYSATSGLVELEPVQQVSIGLVVRNRIFSSIKFLDPATIQSQGKKIYKVCISEAKIQVPEDDQTCYYNAVIKCVKSRLTSHKGHIKADIRKETLGKLNYILFIHKNVTY